MRIASRVTANCACCGQTSEASDSTLDSPPDSPLDSPAPPAVPAGALDRSSARLSTKVRSHQRTWLGLGLGLVLVLGFGFGLGSGLEP